MFKKFLTFFLMGLIFLSSTGFGLIEHTCIISRKKTALLFKTDSCCAKKKSTSPDTHETVLKNNACCELESHVATFDIAPVVEKVAGSLAHVFFYILDTFLSFGQAMLIAGEAVFKSSDSSPPLTGRQLSIRYHSLQI